MTGERPAPASDGAEVVHACPTGTSGVTGCCGRTPFELGMASRMTLNPALVTCPASDTTTARQDDGPWRVGRHYGIHVYQGDRPVATFHHAEDAARAVADRAAAEQVREIADELASGIAGSPGPGVIAQRLRHALGDRP